MSAESDYKEARRRIAQAKAEGSDELDLSGLEQLAVLPPEISELALTTLYLSDSQVSNIAPLAEMTGMTTLYLSRAQVSDITPLAALTGMTRLDLDDTQVSDIAPLADMTGMTMLDLSGTQVSDIAPLADMTAMTTLFLSGTQVSDITPLAEMTGMTMLDLSRTQVSDIAPLAEMTGMTTLYLRDTQVSDITPLAAMPRMTLLDLEGTQVSDLRILLDLPRLESPDGPLGGVHFVGCLATGLDPDLAEIAAIKDKAERAKRLFARLREIGEDWPPAELVPQDIPAAPHYVLEPDRPLYSLDTPPEGGDPEQEDLQQELRQKVRVLLETIASSNEYAPLKRSADTYMRQIDRRLSDIRLRIIWSAANSLRLAVNANQRADDEGRVNDMLPPLAAAALEDLVQTHGLFILGFPNAAALEAEMRSYLGRGRNPEQVDAAKAVVAALDGKDNAIEPEDNAALQADALAAGGAGQDAEMAEISLSARLRNMLAAAGRAMRKAAASGAKVVLAHDFIQFLIGNQTLVMKYLELATDQASAWLPRLLDMVRALIGG